MDIPFKTKRFRKRKKKPASKYMPTNIPFWADISVIDPNMSTPTQTTSINHQNQDNVVELTDDNSPAVPLADGNTQGQQGILITKIPQLKIQEKTQEKIKLNKIQNEKSVTQDSVTEKKQEESGTNQELKKTAQIPVSAKQLGTFKKATQSLTRIKAIPTLNSLGPNQKQKKANSATKSGTAKKAPPPVVKAIPTINSQGAKQKLKKAVSANQSGADKSLVKPIPALNNQAVPKRMPLPGSIRPQLSYQNIYNVQDPNAMAANGPLPRGVPITFLRQQQRLGAIEPQQNYMAMNAAPVNVMPNQPVFVQEPIYNNIKNCFVDTNYGANTAPFIQTDNCEATPSQELPSQAYSPSDLFAEGHEEANDANEEVREGSSSPDICQPGQRRLSAFKRLGPLAQAKKPKLTINLSFDKEQPVREVVGEADNAPVPEVFVPVYKREDIVSSTDDTVAKYLMQWPWKHNVVVRRGVTARASKTAMMMEQEQMEETYDKDNLFIQISIRGYPNTWKKEDVLETLLESVKGKSLIPCFTEYTPHECKFLVIRCRPALVAIHKLGFCIRKNDVELTITISKIDLSLKQIDFLPRLILRKRISMGYDNERKLSLKAFTLQKDVSHFIYFPLNRICNQTDIVELPSTVEWKFLTDLDLSHNRITTLTGFDLQQITPKLQNLNISNNYIEKISVLLQCRELPLKSLHLEGNPLCTDYTDPQHYVRVLKMIFPMLKEIDGLPIVLKGDTPLINKNFCPSEVWDVVEKFLEVYFPILDSPPEDRALMADMYTDDAVLTITHRPKLCLSSVYRRFRNLFLNSRNLFESEREYVKSPKDITRLLRKWPGLEHDPTTFTVDVMWNTDTSILLRIGGVAKLTSESLAVDEQQLAFTRTVNLRTDDGVEYRIVNEMVYWDHATVEYAENAFRITTVPKKKLTVSLETTPDKAMKEQLLNIFMRLTDLDKQPSERCLQEKDWNLKNALEYFIKLLKLNHIDLLCDASGP